MKLLNREHAAHATKFIVKVSTDNLFMLSSSISYYTALALAPFMLIILWIASLLGQDIQNQIVSHAALNFSGQIADMIEMVFNNVNQRVSMGSASGIIGFIILLYTCSVVFLQYRYSFDIIYGNFNRDSWKTWSEWITEKLFAMLLVLVAAILLIFSFTIAAVVEYFAGEKASGVELYRILVFLLNFLIYMAIFSLIHYFTPTKRQEIHTVVKTAALTSVFFIIGNVLLGIYLRSFAGRSVYGAAGTLLVFLVWAYYSSFTVLLSVEVFQYLKQMRKAGSLRN